MARASSATSPPNTGRISPRRAIGRRRLGGSASVPTFYAFIDPNCPHCQQFLREVEPYVTGGKVAVHMIPVGYDDRSRKQAAFALAGLLV